MIKLFKLSELKKIHSKDRRCLECGKRSNGIVLQTVPYHNGIKLCTSIFCNEECFLEYDNSYWQGIVEEKIESGESLPFVEMI